jgi:hypothetical protein
LQLTLRSGLADQIPENLPHGSYSIEYLDTTHSGGVWRELVALTISPRPSAASAIEAHARYDLRVSAAQVGTSATAQADVRQIHDALSQALMRLGLIEPVISASALRDLIAIKERRAVTLVPDTNALANGTMHWLVRALAPAQVWMLPAAISLTTAQRQDEHLKSILRNPRPGALRRALRARSLVNGMLGFLRRHEDQYQVIEVEPQLLRYFAPHGGGSDPDEGDVLEDRLFIEAVQSYFRTTRSRGERRVVTSDTFLTRVLAAEGVPVLSLGVPVCPVTPLPLRAVRRSREHLRRSTPSCAALGAGAYVCLRTVG